MNKPELALSVLCRHRKPWDICGICNPISKTELALSAISRHCQEVKSGQREPITPKQAEELARNFLGRKPDNPCKR